MKKIALALMVLTVSATAAWADAVALNTGNIKWGDAPPIFPKGAKFAVVAGDPNAKGIFVVRLQLPAKYRIPAHNHPTDEYVTVISGALYVGMGDKLDDSKGEKLSAGGFALAPAGMNHYAWTTGKTVVQVEAEGPFGMTYVDPGDDPTKNPTDPKKK
jgi:quercetin dioxygenase-like cupin family protein